MTASSTIEARLRGREGSSAPADATAKLLGIDFLNGDSKARFSTLVHWGYGTAWGGFRGLLAGLGLSLPVGGAVHFGAVWGGELVTLPSLGVAPRWSKWGTQEQTIDAWHHVVYAAATTLAYGYLDRHSERPA
jgi:hypothetical protein